MDWEAQQGRELLIRQVTDELVRAAREGDHAGLQSLLMQGRPLSGWELFEASKAGRISTIQVTFTILTVRAADCGFCFHIVAGTLPVSPCTQ
mgnify:CR=1 FL=1